MCAAPLYTAQVTTLIRSYNAAIAAQAPEKEILDIQRNISSLAFTIIRSAVDNADTREALSLIGRVVPNTYRSRDVSLYVNLKDRTSPPAAPSRPYPATLQTPFLASYHTAGGPYKLLARLDGAICWDQIPKELLASLGEGLHPDAVDMFLIESNTGYMGPEWVEGDYYGAHYDRAQFAVLLKFHQWAFPDLPVGGDCKKHLYMGAFPSFGIDKAQHWPAPIGYMADMEIYAHPDGHGGMLYSPNDAHVAIDEDSPFAALWIAAREGDRCCIAKVILSLSHPRTSTRDPLFSDYFRLSENCSTLEAYTKKLIAFEPQIQEYATRLWQSFIAALERGNVEESDRLFKALPSTQQIALLKQLWIIKGRPHGYEDFGRLSYERSDRLPPELRAAEADKIQAARNVQLEIVKALISEPLELLEARIPSERRVEAAGIAGEGRRMGAAAIAARLTDVREVIPKTATSVREDVSPTPSVAAEATHEATYGGAGRPVSISPVGPTKNEEIGKALRRVLMLKETGRPREELEEALGRVNEVSADRLPDRQRASNRLFTLIYEMHVFAMEELLLQEPSHPKFGEAAFYGIEGAETPLTVITMALNALESELNSKNAGM